MKIQVKHLIAIATLMALAMLLSGPALAQSFAVNDRLPDPSNGFGVGSTNGATTLSYAVIPARSANGGAPAINALSATSDLSTSSVKFYRVTHTYAVTATNATTTLSVNRTNGCASGDVILIRHYLNDSYEKRILTTMTGATNLVTTVAPMGTTIPGDTVYRVVSTGVGVYPVGAATVSPTGRFLFVGQKGMPILLEVNGTSSATLNFAGGEYIP